MYYFNKGTYRTLVFLQEVATMKLSEEQLKSLRRTKGEMNVTLIALAKMIGINRRTLSRALKDENIKPLTIQKINNWLLDRYMNN